MVDFKEKIDKWLHKIAKEQDFKAGYKVSIQQVTGMGYSSANFRVTVSETNRELRMFAKIANINEDLRKTSYARLFTDEFWFYTEVAEKFREIEKRHNVPQQDRFLLPKFYGGDTTARAETIILEDLSQKGFVCYDQQEPFNWEYGSKVVEQLAKFHALSLATWSSVLYNWLIGLVGRSGRTVSFIYGVECPTEFAKLLESKQYHVFDSVLMKQLGFEQTVPTSVAMLEGDDELHRRVQCYLARADRHAELVQLYRRAAPRVLAHGDFKTNNIMYRYHEGQLEVVPVDFQNIHAGSPAGDLLYVVMLGSDEAFRARSLRALRDHYHEQLACALARMGVRVEDVYPECTFNEDWEAALPIGLAVALMILPVTVAARALAARVRGVARDYVRWGIL